MLGIGVERHPSVLVVAVGGIDQPAAGHPDAKHSQTLTRFQLLPLDVFRFLVLFRHRCHVSSHQTVRPEWPKDHIIVVLFSGRLHTCGDKTPPEWHWFQNMRCEGSPPPAESRAPWNRRSSHTTLPIQQGLCYKWRPTIYGRSTPVRWLFRVTLFILVCTTLFAAEHYGYVRSGNKPIPGATVTATLDNYKLVTTTDENGV